MEIWVELVADEVFIILNKRRITLALPWNVAHFLNKLIYLFLPQLENLRVIRVHQVEGAVFTYDGEAEVVEVGDLIFVLSHDLGVIASNLHCFHLLNQHFPWVFSRIRSFPKDFGFFIVKVHQPLLRLPIPPIFCKQCTFVLKYLFEINIMFLNTCMP